jgi:hypothetical protein
MQYGLRVSVLQFGILKVTRIGKMLAEGEPLFFGLLFLLIMFLILGVLFNFGYLGPI